MPNSSVAHDHDLSAIEAAVKETARGRAFLADYARKVRQSDTLTVLALIGRLERWSENQDIRLSEFEGRDPDFRSRRLQVHTSAAVGLLGTSAEHETVTVCDQESASVSQTSNDSGTGIVNPRQSREPIDRIENLTNALRDRDRRIADLTGRNSATGQFTDEGQSALIASVDGRMAGPLSHSAASDAMGRFLSDTADNAHPQEKDVLYDIARALGTVV